MDWREAALAEISGLKPHFVQKHGWSPEVIDGEDRIDLFLRLRRREAPEKEYVLRLRYQPDWREAGRREAFVDPNDPASAGPEHWPPEGAPVNPNHKHHGVLTPSLCLRGVFGFHSVLHPERPMEKEDVGLLAFLVELQQILDR